MLGPQYIVSTLAPLRKWKTHENMDMAESKETYSCSLQYILLKKTFLDIFMSL